jgi:hypothetical protein
MPLTWNMLAKSLDKLGDKSKVSLIAVSMSTPRRVDYLLKLGISRCLRRMRVVRPEGWF